MRWGQKNVIVIDCSSFSGFCPSLWGGCVLRGKPWDLDAQTMIFRAKILVATPISWDVASPCGKIYPLSLLELQPKECWDLYTWYSHGTSTTWARTQPRRRIWNCLTGVHWGCPCQQRSCIITVLPLNQLNQVESEILLAHLLNTPLCRCRKLGAQSNFNMAGPNKTSNCGPASSKWCLGYVFATKLCFFFQFWSSIQKNWCVAKKWMWETQW